jgi:hypothetical protein
LRQQCTQSTRRRSTDTASWRRAGDIVRCHRNWRASQLSVRYIKAS